MHYADAVVSASIVSFTATLDNCTVVARVKERTEAKAAYDAAIKEHKTAALLEKSQHQHDVFTIRLGNLGRRKLCSIAFSYVCEVLFGSCFLMRPLVVQLRLDGEKAQFCLPGLIAPKYWPPATSRVVAVGPDPVFAANID